MSHDGGAVDLLQPRKSQRIDAQGLSHLAPGLVVVRSGRRPQPPRAGCEQMRVWVEVPAHYRRAGRKLHPFETIARLG
jgi:hypothetical protein